MELVKVDIAIKQVEPINISGATWQVPTCQSPDFEKIIIITLNRLIEEIRGTICCLFQNYDVSTRPFGCCHLIVQNR